MNTDELKKVITKNIKANGKGEITGPVLQSVLVEMVNGLQSDGLGFLGIINPGDPAPSNEKVNGYYLSFAVNNGRYPEAQKWMYMEGEEMKWRKYFNGATLNRYCMFIWTQDENGSWKFKRIKYEDHTREDALVVGRALPIWYNEDKTYTIHLSPDGKMTTYAVCGFSPLRTGKQILWSDEEKLFFEGERGGEKFPKSEYHRGYQYFKFRPKDDGKTFKDKKTLFQFLNERRESNAYLKKTASPNYTLQWNKSKEEDRILWTPQKLHRPVFFKRVVKNLAYFNAESKWPSRRDNNRNWWISWRMTQNLDNYIKNGIIRSSKRNNTTLQNGNNPPRNIQRGGMSDNYIIVSNGSWNTLTEI